MQAEMGGAAKKAMCLISIDLAKGAPDFGWPPELLAEAAAFLLRCDNQYPAVAGISRLRAAVARRYGASACFDLGPENVAITAGATEALAACLMATIRPGDEVLYFEPGYISFVPLIERLGGTAVAIPLGFPNGDIDFSMLEAALTSRTRVMVFINPANPAGVSYDRDTVQRLVRFCTERRLLLLADEVWEDVVFAGSPHISVTEIASDGPILKIGAIGKSFAVTGWKIGWIVGSSSLVARVIEAHALLTYAVNPVMQVASAWALDRRETLMSYTLGQLATARIDFLGALHAVGVKPVLGAATYFMLLDLDAEEVSLDASAFCAELEAREKMRALPLSTFRRTLGADRYVRLCFAKTPAVRREAAARIGRFLTAQRAASKDRANLSSR